MFSRIFRILFFRQYFSVEKENLYWSKKGIFFLSFEHLRKSKQILHNTYLVEKMGRFVFRKFVKTCYELDLYVPDQMKVCVIEPLILPVQFDVNFEAAIVISVIG